MTRQHSLLSLFLLFAVFASGVSISSCAASSDDRAGETVAKLGGAAPLVPEPFVESNEDRSRIEQAIPTKPIVQPLRPRRLLIFTRNVGYGGHPSMAYANEAFTLMGKKTGAFETFVTDEPSVFDSDSLKRFDAVFFNNTVGNCFTNIDLRRNLAEFVTGGGGLLGVHGSTVAFTHWPGAIEDWPEFGFMLGARGANHKDSDEHVWLKVEQFDHPLTRVFNGATFDYRDEFFRVHGPYSRDRVRVLLSIDTSKTDVTRGQPRGDCYRADNDYAVAWVRNYGRGRVFYSTIAHNPYVFWDGRMLQFYFAAIQFALGDLPAPTTPSSKLSPARLVQEQFGWRIGAHSCCSETLFEAIDRAGHLGIPYFGSRSDQAVSSTIEAHFGPDLADADLEAVRLKLENAGLRLVIHTVDSVPVEPAACRKLFSFGRKMGIETFIADPPPEALDMIGSLADEYGINVALHCGSSGKALAYRDPKTILKLCQQRTKRLGACVDFDCSLTSGTDPVKAARTLNNRMITVQFNPIGASHRGDKRLQVFLAELHRLNLKPNIFSIPSVAGDDHASELISLLDETTLSLGK